jgi:hypothetical protein
MGAMAAREHAFVADGRKQKLRTARPGRDRADERVGLLDLGEVAGVFDEDEPGIGQPLGESLGAASAGAGQPIRGTEEEQRPGARRRRAVASDQKLDVARDDRRPAWRGGGEARGQARRVGERAAQPSLAVDGADKGPHHRAASRASGTRSPSRGPACARESDRQPTRRCFRRVSCRPTKRARFPKRREARRANPRTRRPRAGQGFPPSRARAARGRSRSSSRPDDPTPSSSASRHPPSRRAPGRARATPDRPKARRAPAAPEHRARSASPRAEDTPCSRLAGTVESGLLGRTREQHRSGLRQPAETPIERLDICRGRECQQERATGSRLDEAHQR